MSTEPQKGVRFPAGERYAGGAETTFPTMFWSLGSTGLGVGRGP